MGGRLAGRERELGLLVDDLYDVRSGRAAVLLVAGEAGSVVVLRDPDNRHMRFARREPLR